ncbi:hypothetical protein QNO07_07750 [Streptomyces sp. 549]|uniref:hypothetical protein n=1 Tax=Streptomyces sp. 549 TaxID=3049076 RepID=UPI0024C3BD10|nr:hypothetical protein [Streptomyces sp. 549]MDK1473314.1 hypothetical protein [Streptomyces sp. 549]
MQTVKPMGTKAAEHVGTGAPGAEFDEGAAGGEPYEGWEAYRVGCPDCARPIALFAHEPVLPRHALCPTPWDPFGLTVCQGSGRPVADALPAGTSLLSADEDAAARTLPQGLDWRTQPFSHAGGPGSRPVRVVRRPQRV